MTPWSASRHQQRTAPEERVIQPRSRESKATHHKLVSAIVARLRSSDVMTIDDAAIFAEDRAAESPGGRPVSVLQVRSICARHVLLFRTSNFTLAGAGYEKVRTILSARARAQWRTWRWPPLLQLFHHHTMRVDARRYLLVRCRLLYLGMRASGMRDGVASTLSRSSGVHFMPTSATLARE